MVAPAKHAKDSDEEAFQAVLDGLRLGKSMRASCREISLDPGTFIGWATEWPGAWKHYEKARGIALDLMAEELLDIADDGKNDFMESNDPNNPGYKVNGEYVQRSRLRVDTRKWYLSKVAPKRYGDKLAVTGGDDDDPPLRMEHSLGGEAQALVAEILKEVMKNAE